ncbi:hypothetical protein QBC46DRAFT_453576, partial [Diplogelasinospora grovesii]
MDLRDESASFRQESSTSIKHVKASQISRCSSEDSGSTSSSGDASSLFELSYPVAETSPIPQYGCTLALAEPRYVAPIEDPIVIFAQGGARHALHSREPARHAVGKEPRKRNTSADINGRHLDSASAASSSGRVTALDTSHGPEQPRTSPTSHHSDASHGLGKPRFGYINHHSRQNNSLGVEEQGAPGTSSPPKGDLENRCCQSECTQEFRDLLDKFSVPHKCNCSLAKNMLQDRIVSQVLQNITPRITDLLTREFEKGDR